MVEREKEIQEWNEQKLPKVPGHSGGRLPGRSTKEARKEEETGEECRERQVRNEIVFTVVAGIEKKARAQVDEKPIAQSWDCSQSAEEEEEEEDCQKGDQM